MMLAEEIVLLAHDDETGVARGSLNINTGVAGAVLTDLALAGRIAMRAGKVHLSDTAGTGHQVIDEVLALIAADPIPRKPEHWIHRMGWGISAKFRDAMVDRGVLRRERTRVWGFIPMSRFLPGPGDEKAALLLRLSKAAERGYVDDARTAVLAGILRTLYMDRLALPHFTASQARASLKQLATGEWADEAVKSVIESGNAVMAGITSTVVIGSATNG